MFIYTVYLCLHLGKLYNNQFPPLPSCRECQGNRLLPRYMNCPNPWSKHVHEHWRVHGKQSRTTYWLTYGFSTKNSPIFWYLQCHFYCKLMQFYYIYFLGWSQKVAQNCKWADSSQMDLGWSFLLLLLFDRTLCRKYVCIYIYILIMNYTNYVVEDWYMYTSHSDSKKIRPHPDSIQIPCIFFYT